MVGNSCYSNIYLNSGIDLATSKITNWHSVTSVCKFTSDFVLKLLSMGYYMLHVPKLTDDTKTVSKQMALKWRNMQQVVMKFHLYDVIIWFLH